MAYVAVDKLGGEHIFCNKPSRGGTEETKYMCDDGWWVDVETYNEVRAVTSSASDYHINIPRGTIKKLIGRDMSWTDDPVDLYAIIK